MTKPNFDAMSEAELRTYVYEHRDDQEAFYAFADRLTAKPPSATYPASMTPEEIHKAVLDIIQQKQRRRSPHFSTRRCANDKATSTTLSTSQ